MIRWLWTGDDEREAKIPLPAEPVADWLEDRQRLRLAVQDTQVLSWDFLVELGPVVKGERYKTDAEIIAEREARLAAMSPEPIKLRRVR